MKLPYHQLKARALGLATLTAALAAWSATAAVPAEELNGRLVLRPLTPQEIKDYALAGQQGASGLATIGIGQPAYLEAHISREVPASEVASVLWAVTAAPPGSKAALAESPLGTNVPIYEVVQRETDQIVGRMMLRPDMKGQYTVSAIVTTTAASSTNSLTITAGEYRGINTCILCHSGGLGADNMAEPWSETGHATFFTRAIDGHASDHYGRNCISCHTVGYDANTNAVNGGFDDVAAQLGWTFPAELTNGNWAAMPSRLKNVSNIQCENCHGPGSEHATMAVLDPEASRHFISTSFGAGNCGQCHDSKPNHVRNIEWAASRHAIAVEETEPNCARCHSAKGFANYTRGEPAEETPYDVITCAACHEPHSAENPHQLRKVSEVKLMDNKTVITEGGTGMVCMNCHMGRRNAATYVDTATRNQRFGPHHGPQADMLAGANAYTYGKNIPSTAHLNAVEDTCAQCHMQNVASTNAVYLKAGGHTFSPSGHTASGVVHLTQACKPCHGEIESFDFARQDYDGDGAVEGAQTEVKGLLHELGLLLPPVGVAKDPEDLLQTDPVNPSWTTNQCRAAFNYLFVAEDGSYGIHNLAYAVGLLKASIADLTDDADHDGISDKWELANFGSLSECNGRGDADADGVNDSLEMAAGTNPKLADTDGDGVSDHAELMAGSDPANAQDMPGLVVKMFSAGEMEFATETGKNYQIQSVTEINTSWQDVGEKIPGTGEMVSRLVSTRSGGSKAFYRVVQVP